MAVDSGDAILWLIFLDVVVYVREKTLCLLHRPPLPCTGAQTARHEIQALVLTTFDNSPIDLINISS